MLDSVLRVWEASEGTVFNVVGIPGGSAKEGPHAYARSTRSLGGVWEESGSHPGGILEIWLPEPIQLIEKVPLWIKMC